MVVAWHFISQENLSRAKFLGICIVFRRCLYTYLPTYQRKLLFKRFPMYILCTVNKSESIIIYTYVLFDVYEFVDEFIGFLSLYTFLFIYFYLRLQRFSISFRKYKYAFRSTVFMFKRFLSMLMQIKANIL